MSNRITRSLRSIVNVVSKEELQSVLDKSRTYGQVLRHFGLRNHGANPRTLKARIERDGLKFEQPSFRFGGGWNKGFPKQMLLRTMTEAEALRRVFVRWDSQWFSPSHVKKLVRHYRLLPDKCELCPITNEWNGKSIVLELDHRDGDTFNNELVNLRWLCPNCHSQTPTFRGRALKRTLPVTTHYCTCGVTVKNAGSCCRSCASKKQKTKIEWPCPSALLRVIESCKFNILAVGRKLGVSDVAVRKHCRLYNVPYKKLVGPVGFEPTMCDSRIKSAVPSTNSAHDPLEFDNLDSALNPS